MKKAFVLVSGLLCATLSLFAQSHIYIAETYTYESLSQVLLRVNKQLPTPLSDKLKQGTPSDQLPDIGIAQTADTAWINRTLNQPEIKALFPTDVAFLWTAKPVAKTDFFSLIAVKTTGHFEVNAQTIEKVSLEYSPYNGFPEACILFKQAYHQTWADMTRKNAGRCLAIVQDTRVLIYPRVTTEITVGAVSISGNFTIEELQTFIAVINPNIAPDSEPARPPSAQPEQNEPTPSLSVQDPTAFYRYLFDKPEDKPEEAFIGLFKNSDGNYLLEATQVHKWISYNDCWQDSVVRIAPHGDCLILISGMDRYNKKPIQSIVANPVEMWPDSTFRFTSRKQTYLLEASCKNSDFRESSMMYDYQLWVSQQGKPGKQSLVTIPEIQSAVPEVLFIGDLDNDGLPDLIINAPSNYENRRLMLFLSSLAGTGELLHFAGEDSYWFDC